MNLSAFSSALDRFLEDVLFGGPIPKQQPLPDPPKKREVKTSAPDTGVKYTSDGLPYLEAKPEGNEASVWDMISAETVKSAGRSKLGTDEELAAGVARGFSAETVALVRMHWADAKTQVAIAKATGLALDTVKKITPIFSKGGKKKKPGAV